MHIVYTLIALFFAQNLMAKDKLIIISPHRKTIQTEFVPAFEKYYKTKYAKDITVEWVDQGGTSDDVRYIRAKFASNKKSSGLDIFWGGGTTAFDDLDRDGVLSPYKLPKSLETDIPKDLGKGVPLRTDRWVASALSTFGIFYNNDALKAAKISKPPTKWEDLAEPAYFGEVSLTDPRRSGTYAEMNSIVLQSMGWEKAWAFLTALAGNTRSFTHSSSDPIRAVDTREVAAAMAIDFYAYSKIAVAKGASLGFATPEGGLVLSADPIAILKGAPNRTQAERFLEFVLSTDAQKLLMLPQGEKDGPKFAYLGRLAVNRSSYTATEGRRTIDFNPFSRSDYFPLDTEKAAKQYRLLNDLVGALLVDNHRELKSAWQNIIKTKRDPKVLFEMPLSEKDMAEFAEKWSDDVFRNQKINEWVGFAKAKYKKVAALKNSH
jgi:ABC-type Fe3+ transport system substrate-binding protein